MSSIPDYSIKPAMVKPLSFLAGETYRTRRNLLLFSALIIALIKFDVGITGVTTSGIGITGFDRAKVVTALWVICLYEFCAYIIKIISDYNVWKESAYVSIQKHQVINKEDTQRIFATELEMLAFEINHMLETGGGPQHQLQHHYDMLDKYTTTKFFNSTLHKVSFFLLDIGIPTGLFAYSSIVCNQSKDVRALFPDYFSSIQITFLVGLAILFFALYFYRDTLTKIVEYDKMEKENDSIVKIFDKLNTDHERLKIDYERLKTDNEQLRLCSRRTLQADESICPPRISDGSITPESYG